MSSKGWVKKPFNMNKLTPLEMKHLIAEHIFNGHFHVVDSAQKCVHSIPSSRTTASPSWLKRTSGSSAKYSLRRARDPLSSLILGQHDHTLLSGTHTHLHPRVPGNQGAGFRIGAAERERRGGGYTNRNAPP